MDRNLRCSYRDSTTHSSPAWSVSFLWLKEKKIQILAALDISWLGLHCVDNYTVLQFASHFPLWWSQMLQSLATFMPLWHSIVWSQSLRMSISSTILIKSEVIHEHIWTYQVILPTICYGGELMCVVCGYLNSKSLQNREDAMFLGDLYNDHQGPGWYLIQLQYMPNPQLYQ